MVLGLLTKDLAEPIALERSHRTGLPVQTFHPQEEVTMGTYGLWAVAAMAELAEISTHLLPPVQVPKTQNCSYIAETLQERCPLPDCFGLCSIFQCVCLGFTSLSQAIPPRANPKCKLL